MSVHSRRPRTLDHFLVTVNSLERASDTYSRLGFHVRPIALHEELGSSNCVIHFPSTYLELLCLSGAEERLQAAYRERARLGEGIGNLSINSRDLEQDRELMIRKGLEPDPILNARRKIVRPDGSEDYTASSSMYLWREDNRFVSLFLSEHKKPDTIFIEAYENHPNSVRDVDRIVYMSKNPSGDLPYFSAVFDQPPTRENANGFCMNGARGETAEVITIGAARARYGGFLSHPSPEPLRGIGVALHYSVVSLDQCRDVLSANGVPYEPFQNGLIVPAAEACGVVSVFEPHTH